MLLLLSLLPEAGPEGYAPADPHLLQESRACGRLLALPSGCGGPGPTPVRAIYNVADRGWGLLGSRQLPRACPFPCSGLPGKQLNSWVPPRALLHWDAGPAVVGP